jgi:hypothetical protein
MERAADCCIVFGVEVGEHFLLAPAVPRLALARLILGLGPVRVWTILSSSLRDDCYSSCYLTTDLITSDPYLNLDLVK